MTDSQRPQLDIFQACARGDSEAVTWYLNHGTDPNESNHARNSLIYIASLKGHADIVQLLLNAGADINQPNAVGFTALDMATRNDHVDVMRLLLTNPNIAKKSTTMFCYCARHLYA